MQYLKEHEMLLTRGAILVGNKTDLERHREVNRQGEYIVRKHRDISKLILKNNIEYFKLLNIQSLDLSTSFSHPTIILCLERERLFYILPPFSILDWIKSSSITFVPQVDSNSEQQWILFSDELMRDPFPLQVELVSSNVRD